jgi:hypothetical protein
MTERLNVAIPKVQFRLTTAMLAVALAAVWLACLHHSVLAAMNTF